MQGSKPKENMSLTTPSKCVVGLITRYVSRSRCALGLISNILSYTQKYFSELPSPFLALIQHLIKSPLVHTAHSQGEILAPIASCIELSEHAAKYTHPML